MNNVRKKVLFLITKSNWGGAQRYVYEMTTRLPSEEYDVVVAFGTAGGDGDTLPRGGELHDMLDTAGIRTITLTTLGRDISMLREFRTIAELWRLFRDEQPDILHLNSSKAVALGALIGRAAHVPRIISTIHGWPFLEARSRVWKLFAWLGSWIPTLCSHAVILVSHHDKKQRMPFCRRKCRVIHTGVPQFSCRPRDAARDELFSSDTQNAHRTDVWLVTYAELTPNKNLFTAIDAVRMYNETARQQVFYTIVGDGEQRQDLAAYIREHGTESSIQLAGHVPDARQYLQAFDIFLLSSRKEGMPYAILEAGYAGLPIIASRVGGIPEAVVDQESGLLIDPDDPATIVQALATLIHQPDLRETYRTNMERRIRDEFSLERMYTETTAVYTNAL